jgi:ETFB lysine methyltransferase
MNDNKSPIQNRIIKEYRFSKNIIKLEQVENVDILVDEITNDEFNQDERLPYWAEVWPSARAFTEYILKNPGEFKNKNTLELGCGIGLVGIAATIAGANVTFSDYEKEAINFTKNNYFLNFREQVETILLDWRNPKHDKQYEIIIATDILYEERFLEPVYKTLQKLLLEKGTVYIAEPDRTIAKPFFEMMKNGFELVNKKSINIILENIKPVTLYIFKNAKF